jgi:cell wall-associated NlpC family hydrolase
MEATYHQDFAGNCIETPSDQCLSADLGPESFDCSGFVLQAIQDVMGAQSGQPSSGIRHVRDMWEAAKTTTYPFRLVEPADGTLIVMRRSYKIRNETVSIPGHIGILTSTENMTFLHASPAVGRVEERPLRTTSTILGGIAIEL